MKPRRRCFSKTDSWIIRVKKEMVFDEDMFILDFLFPGVKRGNSETAESRQKRSKQGRYTKGEAD